MTEPRSTSLNERRGGAGAAASHSSRSASQRHLSARAAVAGGLVAVALAVAAIAGASSAAAAIRLAGELQIASSATVDAQAATTNGASTAAAAHPTCPAGQIAQVQFASHPEAGTRGAATPEAALRLAYPSVVDFTLDPISTTIPNAPVWIVADTRTFEATILPNGGWFVSPVTFVGCHVPQVPRGVPAPGSGPVG